MAQTSPARTVALLAHPSQWAHCVQHNTVPVAGGGVQLGWYADEDSASPGAGAERCSVPARPSGLAYDQGCFAYRAYPDRGAVEVRPPGQPVRPGCCPGPYARPRGLAVDAGRRLYVADPGDRAVLVIDLEQGRLLRRIGLAPSRPIDVAAGCGRAIALLAGPNRLVWLEGRRGPRPGPDLVAPRCPARLQPVRITAGSGPSTGSGHLAGSGPSTGWGPSTGSGNVVGAGPSTGSGHVVGSGPSTGSGHLVGAGPSTDSGHVRGLLVLWVGGGHGVVARPDGSVVVEVDDASDLELGPSGLLVVARQPGQPFRRFIANAAGDATGAGGSGWVELEPVGAPGFDGGAIALTPAGRIAYTTATGIATTTGSVARHQVTGSVTSYRLDSGSYRTRWGRIFLDACLPPHTSVTVRCLSSDADTVPDPLAEQADGYPPLPSASQLGALQTAGAVFRRPNGAPEEWLSDDTDATYEAPVTAAPGRYLWLHLMLRGTDQASPRIRAVRVEHPGHRLLTNLPKAWSRQDHDADFLHRYLTPVEGVLHELDWKAAQRAILLDPSSTPAETLPWLAGFAGLVLDRRWPEGARRTLVAEAYRLFARRGTKAALARLVEIYLGRPPVLVEQWQLRGLGGTVLGTRPEGPAAPRVGGSARATGTLGRFTVGGRVISSDAYRESAHRCTVLVPGLLSDEQRDVLDGLLETHRPAHVSLTVCELGSGMRVGERLRVGLTSYVGPGARWQPAVVGDGAVGTDRVLGRAAVGSRVGSGVVGGVRVG